MPEFNLQNQLPPAENYQSGLLPQRNQINYWYRDTSSRSNLINNFQLSSENRRILNKTQEFTFELISLKDFSFTPAVQKQIFSWVKQLNWEFPTSSIKNIFTRHIFNYLYIWKDSTGKVIAYSVCYFSDKISHIAYVFYHPQYDHSNLPIRLVLQTVVDSHDKGLEYCYLGRFSPDTGFYKRNMPGFEYFKDGNWVTYKN